MAALTATAQAQPQNNINQKEITYEQAMLKYRMIAWLYYPLQYIIVRCFVVGIELSPTLESLYYGFNIPGVMKVITDFVSNIQGVFSVEHILFIFFNLLPYAVRLAANFIPAAAYIYALYTFIIYIISQISVLQHNRSIDSSKVVIKLIGPPGGGKTSAGIYRAVVMALRMWAELKYKYRTMAAEVADYIKAGDVQKVLEWYEVRDAYWYYMTHDVMPCLWSNIPIKFCGQMASVLTYEHAAQLKRLPAFCVLFYDEVGSVFRVDSWRNKPLAVSDFFRLGRHFLDLRVICTEQEPSNVFIDIRRVEAENWLMLEQKWVNKPLLLLIPFLIIKKIIIAIDKDCPKKLAIIMRKYALLLRHIGQRKYRYVKKGSVIPDLQVKDKKRERRHTFYLPTMLNCQYSDRTFRYLYGALNKPIEDDVIFNALEIENTDDTRKRYLRQNEKPKKEGKHADGQAAA